jgi:nitric oxide reductase large subunit
VAERPGSSVIVHEQLAELTSLEQGYWYARSAEFMQQPIVDLLVWLRVPGDTIFAIGASRSSYS